MGKDRFLTTLSLRYLDGQNWELLFPFLYRSSVLRRIIRVPHGFITDFHSVPRFFWRLMPPTRYAEAAVLHDYGYRSKAFTRLECDELYLEALVHAGAPPFRRFLMYWAVRLFGASAYESKGLINVQQ